MVIGCSCIGRILGRRECFRRMVFSKPGSVWSLLVLVFEQWKEGREGGRDRRTDKQDAVDWLQQQQCNALSFLPRSIRVCVLLDTMRQITISYRIAHLGISLFAPVPRLLQSCRRLPPLPTLECSEVVVVVVVVYALPSWSVTRSSCCSSFRAPGRVSGASAAEEALLSLFPEQLQPQQRMLQR